MRRGTIGTGESVPLPWFLQLHLVNYSRFCEGGKRDPVECFFWLSDTEETIRFLKALFSWRYDQRRGKNGRRTPGLKYKSSLETFWKWWHLVYKAEVGHGLSKDTIVKIEDISLLVR